MASTRTGRASVHMLDNVSVDYYGSQMPLNQIAQVHAPEAQLITVQPFDPSSLGSIEKAIRSADIGLNPMNDGKMIRVPVPPLTEERRKDMVKQVNARTEQDCVAIRNVRRDAMEQIKKHAHDSGTTEDEVKQAEKDLQKLTDDYTAKIDGHVVTKEKEIMTV